VTVIPAVAAVTLALAQPPAPSSPGFGPVEVELTDGGVLKLRLLDDKIDFVTPYGVLAVPVRDVRRIDVADRLPPAQEKAIADAVADLIGDDARRREAAKAELSRHGAKAVPPVRRARKQAGPDAAPHVADLLDRLMRDPAAQADLRDHDLLVTDDSQVAGRLTAAALRVYTTQFGELSLRVADVRVIRAAAAAEAEAAVRRRRLVADRLHASRQDRYDTVRRAVAPLLAGLASGELDPADPPTRHRCAVEASRLRRLFAETDDVPDPLLHELRACADVADRRGVLVDLQVRGRLPALDVAVRRALTEAPMHALAAARRQARITVVARSGEVAVSVLADGGSGEPTGSAPADPASAGPVVTVTAQEGGDRQWVEARWRRG
jgi:hypothetical protein